MAMTVKRRGEDRTPRVIVHRVADVRGGVSLATAELGGDFIPEGTPISAPVNGICHVIKTAKVVAAAAAAATTVKVAKGHNLNTGDILMASKGAAAVNVTKIDTSAKDGDTLTLSATLGALAVGAQLVQAAAAGAAGALKYVPFAITGTGKAFAPGDNVDVDAWVMAVTHGAPVHPAFVEGLKGIINY